VRSWHAQIGLAFAAAALLAGCRAPSRQAAQENVELTGQRAQVDRLQRQVSSLEAQNAELEAQVKTLQGLGEKRLDSLFYPHRIELGKMSAGFREDEEWGDAGVRTYVRPVDEQGATLKAAGEVTIELFDLANPPEAQSLGACHYYPQSLARNWVSAGFVNQYMFECRWPRKPPEHPDVTVRVLFVDYLTGKMLTAQAVLKVKLLKATAASASAPAKD
jgi:outer membrane murein-binding lipoprotein Lpp